LIVTEIPFFQQLGRWLDELGSPCRVHAALQTLIQKVEAMSSSLNTAIATLVADNAQLQADIAAAPASIAALIATAIAGQANSGVSAAQMQALTDLHTALGGDHTQLMSALAGTPPVIEPPPPPAA
jgi:septal ring factor EnvC (AmiA/AmiB activator)